MGIECDICQKTIKDYQGDLFHMTGILNGALDGHIHLCRTCYEKINLPVVDFDAIKVSLTA